MSDSGCQPDAVLASYLSHMISALVSLNSPAGYFVLFQIPCLGKAKCGFAARVNSACAYAWLGWRSVTIGKCGQRRINPSMYE